MPTSDCHDSGTHLNQFFLTCLPQLRLLATAVKRFIIPMMVACLLALATGTVEYVHNLQHDREDRAEAAAAHAAGLPENDQPRHHDDSNCAFHRQLHVPIAFTPMIPLLILLGILVAFLSLLSPPLVAQRVPGRLTCRGPPAL